mmetsp:Transcript_53114/g.119207  ORF Transcript_53114/g.119207 Transcript_53114/m.119207 type:complete len:82 (+) Transcript_53114:103-348(+)
MPGGDILLCRGEQCAVFAVWGGRRLQGVLLLIGGGAHTRMGIVRMRVCTLDRRRVAALQQHTAAHSGTRHSHSCQPHPGDH